MPFKDISYLELWRLLCSAKENRLCCCGPGHYEEHVCEIILKLDHRFRSRLNDFLSRNLAALMFNEPKPFVPF